VYELVYGFGVCCHAIFDVRQVSFKVTLRFP
jgi:hypothetical protein